MAISLFSCSKYVLHVSLFLGKKENDDLFDELDTSKLNAHLKELMPGLTAKVFRTYNASITLDEMVYELTCLFDLTIPKLLEFVMGILESI